MSPKIMDVLTSSLGPLPVWAWAAGGGTALFAGTALLDRPAGAGGASPTPDRQAGARSGPGGQFLTGSVGSPAGRASATTTELSALEMQGEVYTEALAAERQRTQEAQEQEAQRRSEQPTMEERRQAATAQIIENRMQQIRNLSEQWFKAGPQQKEIIHREAQQLRSELLAYGVPPDQIPGFFQNQGTVVDTTDDTSAYADSSAGTTQQTQAPTTSRQTTQRDASQPQVVHTVQQGDTLGDIGRRYGIPWREIFNANRDKISDPDLIYPGQQLVIPA